MSYRLQLHRFSMPAQPCDEHSSQTNPISFPSQLVETNPSKDEIVFRNQDQLEQGKEDTQNLCQPSMSHCNKNSPSQLHLLDKCSVLLIEARCAMCSPLQRNASSIWQVADASTFSVKQQFHPGSGHRNSGLTGEREKGHISLSLSS